MTAWADLISKLQTLDDLAKKIQKPSIFSGQNPPEDEIEAFRAEYQEWYSNCLSILEGELKIQFEYVYRAYAKSFILHPTDFHKAGERYGSRFTYPKSQFTFPYSTNFHLFVHYMNTRHNGRSPFINIRDEFDVQDIFHGLLRLFFQDIRPEEGTPSNAGKNSRIDFFLMQEQIIVEIKKTRDNLKRKEVGEELTLDIIYYRKHSGYNTFIGFVYDQDKYIKNPQGLIDDLQQTRDDMNIIIVINQS